MSDRSRESDGGRLPDRSSSGKLRFESAARGGATSGHIGPKSKSHPGRKQRQRFDSENSPQPDRTATREHEPQSRSTLARSPKTVNLRRKANRLDPPSDCGMMRMRPVVGTIPAEKRRRGIVSI